MKMMTITTLLLSLCLVCSAPEWRTLLIQRPEPAYPFNITDPLLRSFVKCESDFQEGIVNPHSGARGILQYLPVMIREVNRICVISEIPERYSWADAFNAEKSIEMWYIIQGYWNPEYDVVRAARIWNPTAGRDYLDKIRRAI